MEIKNQELWDSSVNKNQDFYGKGVICYAERWANLMESKLAEGSALSDIAEATSHEAGTDGITGFMYGCAVSILAEVWQHGAALRNWHNGEYGVASDVEGVVNPALLTVVVTETV
jgi:hypothetical protein